jgi:hypothetical protein
MKKFSIPLALVMTMSTVSIVNRLKNTNKTQEEQQLLLVVQ